MRYNYLRQGGIALILVLWMLTLMTIMAGSFALSMRRESSVISSIRDGAKAAAIAEAGISLAQKMLLDKKKELSDDVAKLPDESRKSEQKKSSFFDDKKRFSEEDEEEDEALQLDGTVYQMEYADAIIRVQIFNERGKIDINSSDQKLLKNLFQYAGLDDEQKAELADAVLDWRDKNDLVRINGAERKQYESEGLQYHPRNKLFESIDELQLVLGMNEEIFNIIEPLITIHSRQKSVDLSVASTEVQRVVSGDIEDLSADLSDDYSKDSKDEDKGASSRPKISQNNSQSDDGGNNIVFTIVAEAKLANGAKSMLKAIVKPMAKSKGSQPFTILDWKRVQINDASLFTEN